MALLNRPLTEDEARKMVADYRKRWLVPSFFDMLQEALAEPPVHVVHYFRDSNRFVYAGPDKFYFGPKGDCTYFIQGTI